MSILITISGLGILTLLLEILNFRKQIVPIVILGLLAALGIAVFNLIPFVSKPDLYGMLMPTGYSVAFSILFIILTILIVAMSSDFYAKEKVKLADYVSLKIFMLAGGIAMVSFGNFAMFFLGLEVLSIAAYVLTASQPKDLKSNEAGMKYFIMGAFASSFILLGITLIYGSTGSFNANEIAAISVAQADTLPSWFYIGVVLISTGMMFKASIAPFHFWAPDVYEGAPRIVTAIMSTLVKVVAIAAFYKILTILAVGITPAFKIALVVISILTLSVGNITALKQVNVKRLMAYSGISHAGFMMMTFLALDSSANVVLYYAAAYSLAGVAAFAVIMAVCNGKDNEDISNFFGMVKRDPVLTCILICAMLSLSGIPIFAGFFAKFFVFSQMEQSNYLILVIFGIINSIIAAYYYFGLGNVMLVKESEETGKLQAPASYKVVAIIAILLNLLLGVFPDIVMGLSI